MCKCNHCKGNETTRKLRRAREVRTIIERNTGTDTIARLSCHPPEHFRGYQHNLPPASTRLS